MQPQQFKQILTRYVAPMFTGATIQDGEQAPLTRERRRLAYLRNRSEMVVRPSWDAEFQLVLRRSQYFDSKDSDFVEDLLAEFSELDSVLDKPFFDDLINPAIRRTVSRRLNSEAASLISQVLIQFETWAEQTYEGRRIAAAIGIDGNHNGGSGVPVLEVYAQSFGAVLANGLDSFLTAAKNGDLIAYEPIPDTPVNPSLFAPLRFGRLADWSKNGKIGLGLNRNGEILLFKDQKLAFAKRRGVWHHFTHGAVITRAGLRGAFNADICSAVYLTCLDVSFARTGGCIALIRRARQSAFLTGDTVSAGDRVGNNSLKGRCLQTIIGKPFHNLDRRLRQDIVAMDGATILDYQGNLIAAGAIVKVSSGSDGGGRLAATKALGNDGVAIKVSTDGEIRGFAADRAIVKELFAVG